MSDNQWVLSEIAVQAQALTNAETAVVAIAEDQGEVVHYAAAVGQHASAIVNRRGAAAKSGLCGVVFQTLQSVLVENTTNDHRIRQDIAQALGIQTAIAVPCLHNQTLVGALMVLNHQEGKPFEPDAERVLLNYARIAAQHVHQHWLGHLPQQLPQQLLLAK